MASSSTLPSTHSTTSTRLKLPSPLSSLTSAGTSRGGGGMSGHRKAQLDKERAQLDSMLDVAFGYDSAEKLAWIELADTVLSNDDTTPQEIGLASAFAGFRQFSMDDHALLGGGWQPWMVQPRRGDGGKEVFECCVRNAQDSIHTFFSRARFTAVAGDYSLAKESARRSLLQALVKSGHLPSDHARRGSSNSRVLSAAEEGSILELPHLSPSLRPTKLALSPALNPISASSISPTSDLSSLPPSAHPLRADPPLTPSDSPQTSPKQFGLGIVKADTVLDHLSLKFDLDAGVYEEEEEGMRTPVPRSASLIAFAL